MINIYDPIETIKAVLKGLPKNKKVNTLKQAIANVTLKGKPPMTGGYIDHRTNEQRELAAKREKEKQILEVKAIEKVNKLLKEFEDNPEAHARKMQREDLKPFMCDRPMDWYFNKENIPNQKLLFELFDEIEKYSFDNLTTDDFINILFYYREFINDNAAEPFKPISRIKAAPLNEDESQLLYKLILKSFGNLKSDMKEYSVLMLVKRMITDGVNENVETENNASNETESSEQNEFEDNPNLLFDTKQLTIISKRFADLNKYVSKADAMRLPSKLLDINDNSKDIIWTGKVSELVWIIRQIYKPDVLLFSLARKIFDGTDFNKDKIRADKNKKHYLPPDDLADIFKDL